MTSNALVGRRLWEYRGGRECLGAEEDFTEEIVKFSEPGAERENQRVRIK